MADSRSLRRDFWNYDSPFADPNGWYGSESDPSGFPSGISLQIAEIDRQSAVYTNAVTMEIFIHKSTYSVIAMFSIYVVSQVHAGSEKDSIIEMFIEI